LYWGRGTKNRELRNGYTLKGTNGSKGGKVSSGMDARNKSRVEGTGHG